MPKYEIIRATEYDYEQIDVIRGLLKVYEAKLLDEVVDVNYVKAEELSKKKDSLIIVAKIDKRILGVGIGYMYAEYTSLSELYVDENYRNLNIGKNIIDEIVRLSSEQNLKSIIIPTLNCNITSHLFYEKIGAKKMYVQYEILLDKFNNER